MAYLVGLFLCFLFVCICVFAAFRFLCVIFVVCWCLVAGLRCVSVSVFGAVMCRCPFFRICGVGVGAIAAFSKNLKRSISEVATDSRRDLPSGRLCKMGFNYVGRFSYLYISNLLISQRE